MPKKIITPHALEAAAEAFATGTASRRKLQAQGIPQRKYAVLHDAAAAPLEAFRTHLTGVLQDTIAAMTERLRVEVGGLSTAQLPVAVGILFDKYGNLTEPATKNLSLHLHLHGKDRAKLMGGLLGADVKRAENAGNDTPNIEGNET